MQLHIELLLPFFQTYFLHSKKTTTPHALLPFIETNLSHANDLKKSLKNQLDSNFFPSLQPEQSLPRVIKLITTHYEELQKQFPYGRQIGAHETGAQKRTYNIDDILIFTIWLIG